MRKAPSQESRRGCWVDGAAVAEGGRRFAAARAPPRAGPTLAAPLPAPLPLSLSSSPPPAPLAAPARVFSGRVNRFVGTGIYLFLLVARAGFVEGDSGNARERGERTTPRADAPRGRQNLIALEICPGFQ